MSFYRWFVLPFIRSTMMQFVVIELPHVMSSAVARPPNRSGSLTDAT